MSDREREVLFAERKMKHDCIEDQVYMFELLLVLEEWLRGGEYTYKEIDKLQKAMYNYMNLVKLTCHRKGMGTKLIKYHLLFNLRKYMDLWGPPKGWDSAPSKTHHTTEVKALSKNTQRRPKKLIQQTALDDVIEESK